ncbi:MAG: hypothetical protein AAF555_03885 [Verrucomicrobiota bacterium]
MHEWKGIEAAAKACGLPYLLVGGHAVNARGFSRVTKDIDIAICRKDWFGWKHALEQAGWSCQARNINFGVFSMVSEPTVKMDLMLLEKETFGKLSSKADEIDYDGFHARVPDSLDLAAMKIHALEQHRLQTGMAQGRKNDVPDIRYLLGSVGISMDSPKFQAIINRYGSPEVAKLLREGFE